MEDMTLAIGVASALVAGGVVAYLLTRSAPPGRKLNPFSAKMAEGCFALENLCVEANGIEISVTESNP